MNLEKFEELKSIVASLDEDLAKFYNRQNTSAGIRLRKAMQDIKAIAQEIRVDIQEIRKAKDRAEL